VTKEHGPAFSFAKIWAADKDSLEEITEDIPGDQGDSWAQALKRIADVQEQRQIQEVMGRGVRRRAAFITQVICEVSIRWPDIMIMHSRKNLTSTTALKGQPNREGKNRNPLLRMTLPTLVRGQILTEVFATSWKKHGIMPYGSW
jgi:hypothetical protein